MSRDEIHKIAQSQSPESVEIPNSWSGIVMWAAGKWGIGVVFLALLVPVYQDLKASTSTVLEIQKTTVTVLSEMANALRENTEKIDRLDNDYRRSESYRPSGN